MKAPEIEVKEKVKWFDEKDAIFLLCMIIGVICAYHACIHLNITEWYEYLVVAIATFYVVVDALWNGIRWLIKKGDC